MKKSLRASFLFRIEHFPSFFVKKKRANFHFLRGIQPKMGANMQKLRKKLTHLIVWVQGAKAQELF